ncbi:MAG TPA: efflux RND transporter periplasmic adaptor subunit [Vicinamibacterales bacterium]|nr:efflux RND transporter periplasmic adaptor subunit [Vicinamibacterales bacterium]
MIRFRTILTTTMLLPALALGGCGGDPAPGQAARGSGAIERPKATAAVPVTVATVARSSIPVELTAIGAGKAFKTVSVESQVAGIVKEVHYRPGQVVHEGDLLITLDTSPFRAALAQAEAALERDKAQAELGHAELERNDELAAKGLISTEQHDQAKAASAAAMAVVRADEAAVQTARIALSYGSVYAPIGGVTGAQLVSPGAAVKANDAPVLVVINQVSPIYVEFSVPQQYLDSIRTLMGHARLPVQATPAGGGSPETGELTFVNNTVDPTTGTMKLMASFPNEDERLWPGQFSDVLLRLSQRQNVLVVPSQAVQVGQQGDYVFVVKKDMTVDVRDVKVAQAVSGRSEVLSGLAAGETVVTDGQVRLVRGARVYVDKGL